LEDFFRNFSNIGTLATDAIMRIIPALICITVHELAHGFTAYKLGDTTAKDMGRLTLNPIRHIDPLGLLMMLIVRFGWAKPVPVNMYNFKHPKWYMAITAIAGPVSNILLAIIFMFIMGLVITPLGGSVVYYHGMPFPDFETAGAGEIIYRILEFAMFLNLALAVFNMLPIPPLDGSKVLAAFLPDKIYIKWIRLERYGMVVILALMAMQLFLGVAIFSGFIIHSALSIRNGLNVFFEFGYMLING